jgi:hypothetical protein
VGIVCLRVTLLLLLLLSTHRVKPLSDGRIADGKGRESVVALGLDTAVMLAIVGWKSRCWWARWRWV